MSDEQKQQAKSWLRGDLPTWVAIGMLGIIGWGLKETFNYFRATVNQLVQIQQHHETRISILEEIRKSQLRQ